MQTTSANQKASFSTDITVLSPSSPPVPLSQTTINALSPYATPSPGLFPIIVLGNPKNHPTNIPQVTLEALKECGVTLSAPIIYYPGIPSNTPAYIEQYLTLSTEVGLKQLIRWNDYDPSKVDLATQKQMWYNLSSRLGSNDTVGGWMLCKDTSNSLLRDLSSLKSSVSDIWQRIVYISMGTSKEYIGSTSSSSPFEWFGDYQTYVRNMASQFHTAVWTNAFYAFHSELSSSSIRSDYFQNLEMFRRLAYATTRPWWGVAKAGYAPLTTTSGSSKLDSESVAIIKHRCNYEAHMMLAFGAQGIVWHDFFDTKSTSTSPFYSPIDTTAQINKDIYNIIKEINTEIEALSDIFLGGSVREVRFSKTSSKYTGFQIGLTTPMGALTYLSSQAEEFNRGCVMSRILNKGFEHIVIINTDASVIQSVTVRFSTPVSQVRPLRSPITSGQITSTTLSLKPGEWAIFSLQLFEDVDLSD